MCSNSAAFSASASAEAALLPVVKTWSAPASNCFFQAWMRVGWTPCWLASSLTVLSPLSARQGHLGLERRRVLLSPACHRSPFPGPPQ